MGEAVLGNLSLEIPKVAMIHSVAMNFNIFKERFIVFHKRWFLIDTFSFSCHFLVRVVNLGGTSGRT